MKISKPSPSMIVALIALVFAMTGTGIAAKTLITGKQIKDGSITSRDLAKNAVAARNVAPSAITEAKLANGSVSARKLAKQAVTGDKVAPNAITAESLAPNSVTTTAISAETVNKALCGVPQPGGGLSPCYPPPKVCPSGVIVSVTDNCPPPPPPPSYATAPGGQLADTFPGIPAGCWAAITIKGFTHVNEDTASNAFRFSPFRDRFEFKAGNYYTIDVRAGWQAGTGSGQPRIINVMRHREGEGSKLVYQSSIPSVAGQPTTQNFNFETTEIDGGRDYLYLTAYACDTSAPTLQPVTMRITPRY